MMPSVDQADRAKELAALHRGIPATRMRDYGMSSLDAAVLGGLTPEGRNWVDCATELAEYRISISKDLAASGQRARAGQELYWAAAALNIGQLARNHDDADKVALFRRSNRLFREAAALSGSPCRRIALGTAADSRLYGWLFPKGGAVGCVIVIGGLSGWGAAYSGIARAMNERNLSVILAEMPGQGETRMGAALPLSLQTLPLVDHFVEAALAQAPAVGIMGNSFGGLLAAHIAARDARIAACCINGAAPEIALPDFRTPREQMEAAFGCTGDELAAQLAALRFSPSATPIACPLLILEGGADPLVPLGAQRGFADGGPSEPTVLTWPDGEHTIYNHATDRNAIVSAWFQDQFSGVMQP